MTANKGDKSAYWDWTPEIWRWNPKLGCWSPEYGGPSANVSLEISTAGQNPAEAYDYWRETVLHGWDADSPDTNQRRGFSARASALFTPRGNLFWYRSDAVSGRRTERQCRLYEGEPINLGLVLAGKRHHEQAGDRAQSAGPGELIFYDPAYPSRTAWEEHSGVHLTLERESVRKALGGYLPPPSQVIAGLRHSRLYPFLYAQLQLLAQYGGRLASHERALVLEQTQDLALAALGSSALDEPDGAGHRNGNGLFLAAQHLVQQQLANPEFNARAIARHLSCSRASLYRAFAQQGLTVAGYLRDARLQRVHQLLQSAPPHLTIAEIAARCGFLDSASFSRLFRHHFGISPRELRHG
ncbi:helix-turn-helix domain-containing protein [Microbulbifer harenosus]|uniref:Helix-turn-helix domain-containing protein n=1 Tax=Microbulbifer harenosus TaxID=2576840 RepID=A0ABY2UHR1_9GAMM|nr:helix-turn-helix domain-containing protein [Microbulbifer harenosus]TLM77067.1 helix-turn-helix domain-containing protein [Microbulbifer harenosus]